jgi:uncharacterized repeat protein (TIGR03837 family)
VNFSPAPSTTAKPALRWDVFCRVIDNHGDLGVCRRLCADLAQRGQRVRLWVDNASALAWMAPQGCTGVKVCAWPTDDTLQALAQNPAFKVADVVVEAFGCELPQAFQALMVRGTPPVWINLEYLSAEDYVARSHSLASPVMSGPAKGCTKWFFFPGFTPGTGGLLREPNLAQRQAAFNAEAWLAQLGLPLRAHAQRVSLFCYEPPALAEWLQQLAAQTTPTDVLVAPGRPHAAVQAALQHLGWAEAANAWQQGTSATQGALALHPLPYLSQTDFDHLLWSCHLNMVRGEDSLVRALWAGQPLVWHIYPQDDSAHHDKLAAFAQTTAMPQRLQAFHAVWNGVQPGALPMPNAAQWTEWQQWASRTQQGLAAQTDLTSQLLGFVAQKS